MLSQYPVFGFIDLGGERRRAASVGMHLLDQPPMGIAHLRGTGARLKPKDLVSLLRTHTARTRRRALLPRVVSVEIVPPPGMGAVEVTFEKP